MLGHDFLLIDFGGQREGPAEFAMAQLGRMDCFSFIDRALFALTADGQQPVEEGEINDPSCSGREGNR